MRRAALVLALLLTTACGGGEEEPRTPSAEPPREIEVDASSTLYGFVGDTAGNPVEGVVVSDGFQCVATDAGGVYEMKRDAAAAPLEDLAPEQWRGVVDVNLNGMFWCLQAAFRVMKAQSPKGGRIINNGSISAHAPRPHSIAYTATKHAVAGMTKAAALDGRAHDIAVGQIDIGNAATDMTQRMAAGILQANGQLAEEPRMDVAVVGQSVLYMANLPLSANVLFHTVMATKMPFVGRG